jgi:Xaa-Pro dipeptidase
MLTNNQLSQDELLGRIGRLQKRLQQEGVSGCIVTQNVDLYYFTGTMQTGYLVIPSEGMPRMFVRRSFIRAREEAAVPVEPMGSFRDLGKRIAELLPLKPLSVALEFDVMPVQLYNRLQRILPHVEWKDGSSWIRETRMIKSAYELSRIREAARITDEAFEAALAQLHPGMTELELIARIEYDMRRQGHAGVMRMRGYNQEVITGMVGAGEAAAVPTYFDGPAGGLGLSPAAPQSVSRRQIREHEPILIDIGCCIDGYVIDQTRTVVIGTLPDDLQRAYETAEAILRRTEEQLRPGTVCEQLYMSSLQQAHASGLSDHYMGFGADQVKFLGHGIGLEVDELPVLAKGFSYPLQTGMVIAIEPKFTFPGLGVVGIENSYAITDEGFEKLTISREGVIRL